MYKTISYNNISRYAETPEYDFENQLYDYKNHIKKLGLHKEPEYKEYSKHIISNYKNNYNQYHKELKNNFNNLTKHDLNWNWKDRVRVDSDILNKTDNSEKKLYDHIYNYLEKYKKHATEYKNTKLSESIQNDLVNEVNDINYYYDEDRKHVNFCRKRKEFKDHQDFHSKFNNIHNTGYNQFKLMKKDILNDIKKSNDKESINRIKEKINLLQNHSNNHTKELYDLYTKEVNKHL